MKWTGPLANRYWAAVLLVLFALVPYLALSSAIQPLLKTLSSDLHMSMQTLALTDGMANAGYAFGTVVAVQIAVHRPQRRMLLVYVALFIIGSVLAATATTPALFIAGHVLQGLCTSLMLIAAVPPLVIGWPASRLPATSITLSIGIFGAVAAGPLIGGIQADAGGWRPLFWIVAGVGVLALLTALLTFEDQPAAEPDAPRDWVAVLLAGFGSAAAFFGGSELQTHAVREPIVLAPLVSGAVLIIALVVYEYVAADPLLPIKKLWTTIPVSATLVAVSAGAAAIAVIELAQVAFAMRGTPMHVGLLFLPELGGAVLAALAFSTLVRTRLIPLFLLVGMTLLCVGAAVLTMVAQGSDTRLLVGSGLVGLGVGASVGPALFVAGYCLRTMELQRVYALLELLRGVGAFLCAPILLHVAMSTGSSPAAGTRNGEWVAFAVAAAGGVLAVTIWLLGRPPLRPPEVEPWQHGEARALHSPPLLDTIRSARPAPGRHEDHAGRHELQETGRHELEETGRHERR